MADRVALTSLNDDGEEEEHYFEPVETRQSSASSMGARPRWYERLGTCQIVFLAALLGVFIGMIIVFTKRRSNPLVPAGSTSSGQPQIDLSDVPMDISFISLITLDEEPDRLLLVIPQDQMNKPFIISAIFSKGDSEMVVAHMPAVEADNIFAFRESPGDGFLLDLYQPQEFIRVGKNSSLESSAKWGAYDGFLMIFEYYVDVKSGDYVIDASMWAEGMFGIFDLSEFGGVVRRSKIKAFPMNFNIEMEFEVPDEIEGGIAVAGAIEFSFINLPEDPMTPREADERLGYFTQAFVDLDSTRPHRYGVKEYLLRRRLEKSGKKSGNLEHVKEPITFYIDESVPESLRPSMKRGIENWQKAFEAAGYKDAIIAVLPGEKNYPKNFDAADVRYNSISWEADLAETFALGPSNVDPRTGEIINAAIVFTHGWIRAWTSEFRTLIDGKVPGFKPYPTTGRKFSSRHHVSYGHLNRIANATILRSAETLDEFWADGITDISMHEVGHTLGLRHNFRGSANYEWEKLKDKDFVEAHGVSSSVMDYTALIVMADEKDQNKYFTPCVGDYDVAAIKYGYMNADRDTLDKIAEDAVGNGLHFGTDEDMPDEAGLDPFVSTYDAGANPMDYHENVEALVNNGWENIKKNAEQENLSWSDYTMDYTQNLHLLTKSASYATKFIGGIESHRPRSMSSGKPLKPVSRDLQTRAMDFIKRVIDPVDGYLGYNKLNVESAYLVDLNGPGCSDISSICLALSPVDIISLSSVERMPILLQLLYPERLSSMNLTGELSVADMIRTFSDVFFNRSDAAKLNPAAAKFLATAQADWLSLLKLCIDPVYGFPEPVMKPLIAAEIGRIRELSLGVLKDKETNHREHAIGMCNLVSDFTLA